MDRLEVPRNISLAEKTLEKNRETFLKDHHLISLIEGLKAAIEHSEIERLKTGVAAECARCGVLNNDCCGRGIELRYSRELLLINLLLDVNLPTSRHNENSCYFLTPEGCCLKARDVFCINFLCRKITDRIPPERLLLLREFEGEMLEIIFRLEERIKMLLSKQEIEVVTG
ncbi:MAG: hypothetical protein ACK415_06660 [Thermodesulfovibrionales bacterium]